MIAREKKYDIKLFRTWVDEAMFASSEWRRESWRDCEIYDGGIAHWSERDFQDAKTAGITPLTINRTFPVVNLLLGHQVLQKNDIIAKGRTRKDGEISQVMTEGIKFCCDQNRVEYLITQAYQDAVIPGFGVLNVGINQDPRKERIKVSYRSWMEMFWDPFSSPWWDAEYTKYVFHSRWMDLSDLQAIFPEKEKELADAFEGMSGSREMSGGAYQLDDAATMVEEDRRGNLGWSWVNRDRVRVRPVEMWYPIPEKCSFAVMADGRAIQLDAENPPADLADLVRAAKRIDTAIVRKMHTVTFLGDLVLQQNRTPHGHDEFPFVPFIGYVDRWLYPYGVPRQIRGQNEEVNRRRSMALALLKSRRVMMESDAVGDGTSDDVLQKVFEEANKLDGFIVLKPGALSQGKIQIVEQAQLQPAQVALMQQSEREIQEISGANAERMGYQSAATSGVALQKKVEQGQEVTARLIDNLRRSQSILGSLLVSAIQNEWAGEKVLRITDRWTGAERFVALNQPALGPGGQIVVKNDITQGVYDIVVSEAPQTDTTREQYMNLIIEWVKKSPPEIIPQLMLMAFELSDIPNKEQLLSKIKLILGEDPAAEDMSPEEARAQAVQALEAQRQAQGQQAQVEQQAAQLDMQKRSLENEKLMAEINRLRSDAQIAKAKLVEDIVSGGKRLGLEEAKTAAALQSQQKKAAEQMGQGTIKQMQRGGEQGQ